MVRELTPELEALLRLFTVPAFKIPDFAAGETRRPRYATIREIDIKPAGQNLKLEYSRANYDVDLLDYPGGLGEVLELVRTDGIEYPHLGAPNPAKKFATELSLHNERFVYVIFKLSGRNWQFAHSRPPAAIGIQGWIADLYREARRVDSSGNIDSGQDPNVKRAGCKVAYFVADGEAASSPRPARDYIHPFNFHVDLITKDSDNQAAYIPITIDPDIRFPGGSGS